MSNPDLNLESNSAQPALSTLQPVLNNTADMIRLSWKAEVCLFFQIDDEGLLRLRASSGLPPTITDIQFAPSDGLVSKCLSSNQVLEAGQHGWEDALMPIISAKPGRAQRHLVVPVAGQSRVLGALMLIGVGSDKGLQQSEAELRSAGALCAVLFAYSRLQGWIGGLLPNFNHSLRTPLTAVKGSIGMVLGGVFGEVGSDVKAMLEMAHSGCERTVNAIEDFLKNQIPKP